MPVTFLVIGDERARLMLDRFPHVLADEMSAASRDSALWLEAGAKMFVAPHSKTGNLERNISSSVEHVPGESKWTVALKIGMSAPYGVYVNFGTGIYHVPDPHTPWGAKPEVIMGKHGPKIREFLRWYGRDGRPIFARQVRGQRPVLFVERSFEVNREKIRLRYHAIPGNVVRRLEATP